MGVFFLAVGFFLITGVTSSADVVTILFPAELSQNSGFTDKAGSSLLNGYLIRVGTFGNAPTTVASNWVGLTTTGSILSKIEEQFTPYDSFNFSNNFLTAGTAYYPPDPEDPVPPAFGTDLFGKPIDIVFYNNADALSASQILIVRMKTDLQIDSTSISAGKFNTFANLFGGRDTVFSFTADRVDLLWGFYNSQDDVFQTAVLEGGVNQITSPLTETNASGAVSTYQITANNGADRFFATTNTANADLTLTTLPTGFSIATNTGVITAGTNAAANTYSIRLVASNSLTASVATNTLTWVLKTSNLSFTNGQSSITATLGKGMTSNFTSTGINPTYTVASGKLFGLTLTNSNGVGVLSGTPNRLGSNSVWIQSTSGTNVGATNFTLVVNPFSLGIVGLTDAGVLECTAGVAQTNNLTNSEDYTDLDWDFNVNSPTPGLSINNTNLVFSQDTVPLLKGSSNISLTLTASRAVGGTTVSSSTTVPLRIVAPPPRRIVGETSFEVDVGEPFSTTILTDAGSYASLVSLNNAPPTLRFFSSGLISGTDNSNTSPFEYLATVVFDSQSLYEGGGILTANVIFRLRNLNAPIITSRNRCIGGINRTLQYEIKAENQPKPSRYEFIGTLPPGLTVTGTSGETISGKPTTPGNYPLVLKAYNERRPGSTDPLDEQAGIADLILVISGSGPAVSTPVASINNMTTGMVHNKTPFITTDGGMRLFAIGLPTGLTLDEDDGTLSGTNTASGIFNVTLYLMNGSGWTIKKTTLNVK